jgi:NAD(P)-dependent dehydrogenase (short-subunit alcohol dehydrogenase family)
LRLENKVVLISGGASGIGAETARRVVRDGGKAVLGDRDEEKGRALAEELGPSAAFVTLDVVDEQAWQKAVATTVDTYGSLHGLLNAAGIGVRNSIEDCSLEEYRRVNDVNSMGTFLGCKSAIPAMARSGGGSIVNISSVLGLRGASYAMAYCASKGAVRMLTKSIALHAARAGYNIRCNSLHPSFIDTPMVDALAATMGGARAVDAARVKAGLEQASPLGRLGHVDDVTHLVVYLASDESRFITGAELPVDGGLTAR